jgi:hypothetical protein
MYLWYICYSSFTPVVPPLTSSILFLSFTHSPSLRAGGDDPLLRGHFGDSVAGSAGVSYFFIVLSSYYLIVSLSHCLIILSS